MLLVPVNVAVPYYSLRGGTNALMRTDQYSTLISRPFRITGTFLLICSLSFHAFAQLEVPGPIVLEGATPEQRQILGLADPQTLDAAISLGALRASTVSYTQLQGTADLTGTLVPAPDAYTIGLIVTALTAEANLPDPTLDLNGLGQRPIVKQGGLPLDSADLLPGIPVRLVYDGAQFQLISSGALPCPSGLVAVGREYCVATHPNNAVTFFEANRACAVKGTRLCTLSEWAHACYTIPAFLGTVTTAEWVDHAANDNSGAKLVGAGNNGQDDVPGTGCHFGAQSPPYTPYRYRCCSHR